MAKCFMCGSVIAKGILCEKCDKPRKKSPEEPPKKEAAPAKAPAAAKAPPPAKSPAVAPPPAASAPAASPGAPPAPSPASSARAPQQARAATAAAEEPDPFPKAPVVPFPVEAASPALTSVVSILVATGVPSILLGPDRTVKFVSDEAKHMLDAASGELNSLKALEAKTGIRIGELSTPVSAGVRVRNASMLYSLVPLSGGAGGAVLVFRHADADSIRAPFVTYVRETVLGPLRSLRDSLLASARNRPEDPILSDAAGTIEQVLSSLEMAPEVGEGALAPAAIPTVTDVVHAVANRFRPFADLKGVELQVDVQELEERFRDSEQLNEALGILMDNAMHYVPPGGQVVIGVRWMEHKSKPLLLFFVMDTGTLVPETLRQMIFEPAFVWNPQSSERTGRSLFRTREFAVAHAGSVWVESKTGKACTFFLRVRPDGAS